MFLVRLCFETKYHKYRKHIGLQHGFASVLSAQLGVYRVHGHSDVLQICFEGYQKGKQFVLNRKIIPNDQHLSAANPIHRVDYLTEDADFPS